MTKNTVKSLAKEIASEILKKNEPDQGLKATATIRNAFDYYFKTKKISSSTLESKKSLYVKLEQKNYLDKLIKDLTGAEIREFIGSFKLKDSSAHALYSSLMSVLMYYVKDHNLGIEFQKGIIKYPKRQLKEEDTFITWEEIKMLLALDLEKDQFFVDFFCMMCLSGMAVGDCMKFTPQQNISADEKWIVYHRQKTGSKCRLPLFPQLKSIVAKYDWPCRISKRTIQNRCDGLISDLLGRKIKSHDGRKAFGCLCLTLGFSVESTASFMGHSNPIITSKIYSRVLKEKVQNELTNLPPYAKEIMGL